MHKRSFLAILILSFLSFQSLSQISGVTTLCVGSSSTLTGLPAGGSWSGSNASIASIGSATGILSGISGGVDTITYNFSGSISTTVVTVNPSPSAITGSTSLCGGVSTTFSNLTPGGVWTSSTPSIASIGSSTGVVNSVSYGSAIITYSLSTGCYKTTSVNVITYPPIIMPICNNMGVGDTMFAPYIGRLGYTYLLFSTNPFVVNTSYSNPLVALSTGSSVVSWVDISSGCAIATNTINVTPTALVKPISPVPTSCPGVTFTLTGSATGGIWSSSMPGVATISSSGTVTTISGGGTTISYSMPGTSVVCIASEYVLSSPTISASSSICLGDTAFITAQAYGSGYSDIGWGGWFSVSDTSIVDNLTHDNSGFGRMVGLSPGLDTIRFVDLETGCATYTLLTVNPVSVAATTTGDSTVCIGSSITLTNPAVGGTWNVTNSTAIVSGGLVTGISPGIDTIRYTVSSSCGTATAMKVVSVDAIPVAGAIAGAANICIGTPVTLTDISTGGLWTVSNPTASVSGSGIVTGISDGVDTVSYSIINICGSATATKTVTVTAMPVAGTISGALNVCLGTAVTLTDMSPGGIWSSSGGSATVTGGMVTGIAAGTVTGITAGTDTISYTVTNMCGTAVATEEITINPLPAAGTIAGTSIICIGTPATLTDTSTGGVWSSSNGNATVTAGVATAISAGVDTIMYSVVNICGTAIASKTVTVEAVPVSGIISGPSSVCVGAAAVLTDTASLAFSSGIWSSGAPTATIDTAGILHGVTAGSATISYTISNGCGTATALDTVLVNPLPFAGTISGSGVTICAGDTTTLTDTVSGGIWSSNADATVSGGFVTTVAAGIDTIGYSVTNSCGTAIATRTISINPLPSVYPLTGGGSYCLGGTGVHIGLGSSDTSITYMLYQDTTLLATLAGTGTSLDFGLFTAAASYFIAASNPSTGCLNIMSGSDTVSILDTIPTVSIFASSASFIPGTPDTLTATVIGGGGSPAYQWYINGTAIPGATDSSYINTLFFAGDSVSCSVTSSLLCGSTGTAYTTITFSTAAIQNVEFSKQIAVYPNPVTDKLIIAYDLARGSNGTIEIMDITGRLVANIPLNSSNGKQTIDTHELTKGIYIYKILQGNQIYSTGKVIKE